MRIHLAKEINNNWVGTYGLMSNNLKPITCLIYSSSELSIISIDKLFASNITITQIGKKKKKKKKKNTKTTST